MSAYQLTAPSATFLLSPSSSEKVCCLKSLQPQRSVYPHGILSCRESKSKLKWQKTNREVETVLVASPGCDPEVPILHISTVNSLKCTLAPLALLGNDPISPLSSREESLKWPKGEYNGPRKNIQKNEVALSLFKFHPLHKNFALPITTWECLSSSLNSSDPYHILPVLILNAYPFRAVACLSFCFLC